MNLKIVILCIVLKLQLSSKVTAFSSGAGSSACETLTPQHGSNEPQITEAPFVFNLSTQNVGQGETMTISIEAENSFGFRGFMIQARTLTEAPEVIGQFEFIEGSRSVSCADLPPNSVATHSSSALKIKLQLTWQAPINFVGIINFQYV